MFFLRVGSAVLKRVLKGLKHTSTTHSSRGPHVGAARYPLSAGGQFGAVKISGHDLVPTEYTYHIVRACDISGSPFIVRASSSGRARHHHYGIMTAPTTTCIVPAVPQMDGYSYEY